MINCVFDNAAGDSVDYDYGRGTLRGNHFENTGNDAIDLMTSHPLIVDNVIIGAGDKGISIDEHSQPIIINTQIESAHTGIESKDGSRPLIVNVHLRGCRAAVNAYAKNWRYNDGGHAQLYNSIIENCTAAVTADKRSDVGLTHCALVGTPASPVNKRVSLINCTQSSAARPAPYALIYRELGMPAAASIGLDTPGAAIKPMPVVFRTRFREDFTSNLDGWLAGDGDDAFKSAKTRVVRARNGRAAVIERVLDDMSVAAGLFIFEARTTTPAAGWVVFDGQSKHRSRVELNEAYTRHSVVVPDMKLRRIALHLPADQRTYIRLLELRAPGIGGNDGHNDDDITNGSTNGITNGSTNDSTNDNTNDITNDDGRSNNRIIAKDKLTHRPHPSNRHAQLASTD